MARFKTGLGELEAQDQSVESDLRNVTAMKCVAEIFVSGKSRARCKFWIGNGTGGEGIKYSESAFDWNSDNSFNEQLSNRNNGLALHALMKDFGGQSGEGLDLELLTPEATAEYLWRRFTWRLG